MAEFLQALDPSKLVMAGTTITFLMSPFTAPPYNLPIFLFGTIAQELSEAPRSVNMFALLLASSIVFDIIWMTRHEQNGLIRFLTIVVLLLKIPTLMVFSAALQQASNRFGLRGRDVSDATVWSMPGGFTSAGREGYQTVDEESPVPPAKPPPPFRSTPIVPQPSQPAVPPTVGTYQSS